MKGKSSLEDNIEIMPIEVKPNEIVLFYRNNKLVENLVGNGFTFFWYDKRKGRFRTERIYVP
ncbi:MAG: hypothetical protein V1886_04480 [archaeon]